MYDKRTNMTTVNILGICSNVNKEVFEQIYFNNAPIEYLYQEMEKIGIGKEKLNDILNMQNYSSKYKNNNVTPLPELFKIFNSNENLTNEDLLKVNEQFPIPTDYYMNLYNNVVESKKEIGRSM